MEGHLQKSPNLGLVADNCDAKYVSGLSTMLVATIQETKDRISQIEYIFCSQLFPSIQPNTQSLQKIYLEAREAAEDAYREKEKEMLLQIKKLQCQNQQILEENKQLKLEQAQRENCECHSFNELQEKFNRKTLEANERKEAQENLQKLLESKSSLLHTLESTKFELEEKNNMFLRMHKKLELDTRGLQQDLNESNDVDDMMEVQNKLLQVNQSKSSLVLQKENQLKEYEERISGLVARLEKMEGKTNELQSEVEKRKELEANLLKKIEFQAAEMMDNEQVLDRKEMENRLLVNRVDELQEKLRQKTSELDEVRNMRDQLLQENASSKLEIVERGQALEELQEEKKRLLDIKKGLDDRVDKLEQKLSKSKRESSERMELNSKLLKQIEAKDSEIDSLSEKRRQIVSVDAYKRMKSQFYFLLKEYNLTEETMLHLEGAKEALRHDQIPEPSYDIEKNTLKASDKQPVDKEQVLFEAKKEVQRTSPASLVTSRNVITPKGPSSSKHCPTTGVKRPHSHWRDTRSHQSRVGPDPHDDFLDTPLENIRDDLGKAAMKEVRPDFPKPSVVNTRLEESDDQTQDISADARPNKLHKSPHMAGTSGFKYVEPVRKKSERETLKGVECKQCKKFYDAVLPGAGDADKRGSRCEHHDGVSRHRYRYAPPSTPEGFWNIGFESEM